MNDDDLTTNLHRALHDRADAMHGSSLGLADVTGRARTIRRRRAATAVVGAAAAVALIVPTAALASHGGSKNEPAPAITQTPAPGPTDTPTATGHQPAPGILDVSDLPTGYPPRVEYVTGGTTLHRVVGAPWDAGTRYPVVGFVAMYDGSKVWQTSENGQPYVEVQESPAGRLLAPAKSGWGLATNVSHTAVAWVGPGGQVMVRSVGHPHPWPLGDPITAGTDLRVAVVSDACGATACSVYVNVASAQGGSHAQPWEATVSGTHPLADGGYLGVADLSTAGLTIGISKLSDFGSCSKLLGGGEFAGWSTCRNTLVSFSPDGKLVLGDPAYHDGIGNGEIAMYDAGHGDRLFDRHSDQTAQSHFPEAQWEDSTHVLAPVFQDGRWAIVRIASDGSMEYAVPPLPGQDTDNPYVLATGGMSFGD